MLRAAILVLATTPWLLACGPPGTDDFRVIGHRGAAGRAPENTLAALGLARALGLGDVEVDVRRSRDGALLLFHDGRLDEKTDLSGAVADHDLATLREADIGSWFDRTHPGSAKRYAGTGLTTPEDAFASFGRLFNWHVEIKGAEPEIPAQLVAALRAAGLERRAMVTSFDEAQLERVRALAPELPLCRLAHRTRPGRNRPGPMEVIERSAERGYAMVAIAAEELLPDHVERAHELGLRVRAFGVDDDALLERVIALGADGATVDHPERALALLRQRKAAR